MLAYTLPTCKQVTGDIRPNVQAVSRSNYSVIACHPQADPQAAIPTINLFQTTPTQNKDVYISGTVVCRHVLRMCINPKSRPMLSKTVLGLNYSHNRGLSSPVLMCVCAPNHCHSTRFPPYHNIAYGHCSNWLVQSQAQSMKSHPVRQQ